MENKINLKNLLRKLVFTPRVKLTWPQKLSSKNTSSTLVNLMQCSKPSSNTVHGKPVLTISRRVHCSLPQCCSMPSTGLLLFTL